MQRRLYMIVNYVNNDSLRVTCTREEVEALIHTLNVIDPDGIYDLSKDQPGVVAPLQ